MADDHKLAHLGMIQGVITRMAGNSFLIKGWAIVLVSSLFALGAAQSEARFAILAYFPVVMLWILDGYFLDQERRFRKLYDSVRGKGEDEIDFSMETEAVGRGWWDAAHSVTLLCFYLPLLLATSVVLGLLMVRDG